MVMTQPIIFLDDGGVMNDNDGRGPLWREGVAEFFVPRLGGTEEAWREANRIIIERILEQDNWTTRLGKACDYVSFDRVYQTDWLNGMCELVGVPLLSEEECYEMGHEATAYITGRAGSPMPGIVEAVRTLHARGYTLHTASGESSLELDGYLNCMGIRACFGRLYGPDLINTFKNSPLYYERLFADLGIAPADALVVDDSPLAVAWAVKAGARAVLSRNWPLPVPGTSLRISCLGELPDLLEQLN